MITSVADKQVVVEGGAGGAFQAARKKQVEADRKIFMDLAQQVQDLAEQNVALKAQIEQERVAAYTREQELLMTISQLKRGADKTAQTVHHSFQPCLPEDYYRDAFMNGLF